MERISFYFCYGEECFFTGVPFLRSLWMMSAVGKNPPVINVDEAERVATDGSEAYFIKGTVLVLMNET